MRASAYVGGSRSGVIGENLAGSRPASVKSGDQSGGDDAVGVPSTCGGTASNAMRRPSGSSRTAAIPDVNGGGSSSDTKVKVAIESGAREAGLRRYQKNITAGG